MGSVASWEPWDAGLISGLCQWVKDLVLSQRRLQSQLIWSLAWEFCMPRGGHKRKEKLFYRSMVDKQCGINFYCIAKRFSYTYIYYIYMYTFFFIFFSVLVVACYWTEFPVPYGRTLLFTCPRYTSLPLLTRNSHSFPPPLLSPLATISLSSMSVSVSVSWINSFEVLTLLMNTLGYF